MSASLFNLNLNGLELLVVEDDPPSAFYISRTLAKHGAKVEIANSGSSGFLKYQQRRYPVIITDINMPGMSGLELVSRIKALDRDTQIIATTANSATDCLVSAVELGFSDYFLKPIEINKLLLAVKKCGDVIEAKYQLESEREKFRSVFECLGEGIYIKDLDYRISYQNSAIKKIFGDRVGSFCYEVFGENEPCQNCPTDKTLQDGQAHSAHRSYQHDGATFQIESTTSLLRDSRGKITGTIEIIRDITEHIKNQQAIRDMAFHDPLTGLANRRLFEDRLEQAIAKAKRYEMKLGLLYMDLDYFKEINDTFGHEAGDQVLVEAAQRIKSCCKRELDTISRLGGDEFCIVFSNCGDIEELSAIAQKLLAVFAPPFLVGDAQVKVTTSIGIAIFPDNGSNMKGLEIAADRAMYAAKKAGRNTCRSWEPCASK